MKLKREEILEFLKYDYELESIYADVLTSDGEMSINLVSLLERFMDKIENKE